MVEPGEYHTARLWMERWLIWSHAKASRLGRLYFMKMTQNGNSISLDYLTNRMMFDQIVLASDKLMACSVHQF